MCIAELIYFILKELYVCLLHFTINHIDLFVDSIIIGLLNLVNPSDVLLDYSVVWDLAIFILDLWLRIMFLVERSRNKFYQIDCQLIFISVYQLFWNDWDINELNVLKIYEVKLLYKSFLFLHELVVSMAEINS